MFNKEQNATLVDISLTSRYLCPNKTFFKNCLIFFVLTTFFDLECVCWLNRLDQPKFQPQIWPLSSFSKNSLDLRYLWLHGHDFEVVCIQPERNIMSNYYISNFHIPSLHFTYVGSILSYTYVCSSCTTTIAQNFDFYWWDVQ